VLENNVTGVNLLDSAATSQGFTVRNRALTVLGNKVRALGDDLLVEHRLQHPSARSQDRKEERNLLESAR
jgi:hypothetical protein